MDLRAYKSLRACRGHLGGDRPEGRLRLADGEGGPDRGGRGHGDGPTRPARLIDPFVLTIDTWLVKLADLRRARRVLASAAST